MTRRCFAVLALILVPAARAQEFRVAVTIDDVPWSGAEPSEVVLEGTDRMLVALTARGVPATGFAVCDGAVGREAALRTWRERGFPVGNHSGAHRDLNTTDMTDWLRDAERCREFLAAFDAADVFRYPMLHRGDTETTRDAVSEGLHRLGYRVAPVTIDNSEWVFARQYRDAVGRGDQRAVEDISGRYIAHLRRATHHARVIARGRFGRDVAHILLLHANQLNADRVGAVLDSLTADGATFVTLDEAMRDSIYALRDDYVGRQGLSWLYRVAPAQPNLAVWDDEEEAEVRRAFRPTDSALESVAAELRHRSDAFSATYIRNDPVGIRDFYTEDGVLVLPGGRLIEGGDAIQRYWMRGDAFQVLEHRLRSERLQGDDSRVVEVGRWFSTSQRPGREPVSGAGRYVVEWVRGEDGQWRMAVDTWHQDPS